MTQARITALDAFRFNNPFLRICVDEREIWAEGGEGFQDVESINKTAFEALNRDIEFIARDPNHTTKVRFLVGASGSGKSHIFSRLRRSISGKAIFAFASNPPLRGDSVARWLLNKVVAGLRHPHIDGQIKPYSQLHAVLDRLLSAAFGPGKDGDSPGGRVIRAQGYLKDCLRLDSDLARGLAWVLDPERSDLVFRWLAGSFNLREEELRAIEQQEPLGEGRELTLLEEFGRMTAIPIVLALDQLDLMTEDDHTNAFQRLLFDLINDSCNWYVVISLRTDNFDRWRGRFSGALRRRLEASGARGLPVVELHPLADPAEKQRLLLKRLVSLDLNRLREQYHKDNLYPFSANDIGSLMSGAATFPGRLLNDARERYDAVLTGTEPGARELAAEIQAEFEKARALIDENALDVEQAVLADRLAEVLQVVSLARGKSFEAKTGPLEGQTRFRGTDTLITIEGREVRVLGHHIQQGQQFPAFLQKVMRLPRETVLVRDGAVGLSGRVTGERLAEFKRDKAFVHLPRPELADAFALGQVLAEMREGDFSELQTGPPPTEENVMRCLGAIPELAQSQLVQMVEKLLEGDGSTETTREETTEKEKILDKPLIEAIRTVMESARWLVLERLHRCLQREYRLQLSLEELVGAIIVPPLKDEILCYPQDLRVQTSVHILIWNLE